MLVEIYTQIPQSGSVTERRFDATGNCTWVRFAAADADEWTGVFGNGDIVRHSKAVLFGDNRTAFVIAAGQGYIVDAVTGEMLHKTPEDCFCDAISVPGRDFIIACDFTDLYAVSQSGVIWRSERIALDGIKFGSTVIVQRRSRLRRGHALPSRRHRNAANVADYNRDSMAMIR